jgi:hypothetical protein
MAKFTIKSKKGSFSLRHSAICITHNYNTGWLEDQDQVSRSMNAHRLEEKAPHEVQYFTEQTVKTFVTFDEPITENE